MKMDQTIKNNYNYPRLNKLSRFFVNKLQGKDFSKTIIITCQHILSPQKEMFSQLIKIGFLPQNIYVLGKAYSTNREVLKEIKNMGIFITQPKLQKDISFDNQHKENCSNLIKKTKPERKNIENIVLLDDGGVLIEQFIKQYKHSNKNIFATEQTSSGFRKLENKKVNFPIYNVARSKIKLELETPHIIELGIKRIKEVFNVYKLKNPNILVVGLGPIGIELKNKLQEVYSTISYDKIHGEKSIINLIVENNIDVVVGATGSQILSHKEIVLLNNKLNKRVFFISISSSDREFEIWKLKDLFKENKGIHNDVVYKNITVVNNGFPITFKGNYFESTPKQMERTICLLFSGVCLSLIENNKKGFIDFPETITELLK